MADTIITNSPDAKDSGAAAGWVVALVIVIAVVVGGIVLYQNGAFRAVAPATESTNINVTVPEPATAPSVTNTPPAVEAVQ